MASVTINTPGNGLVYNTFLNNQLSTPRLCITSEEAEFDTETIRNWQNEGFDVSYVPLNNGGKDYIGRLNSLKEGLRVGEQYAIIAYGDAAAVCLDHFHKPTAGARLTALIAYYPTSIPDARTRFPPSLKVLVHLAGDTIQVVSTPQVLGLQSKKKRVATRKIDPGVGIGDRKDMSYTAFTYEYVQPGFGEHDMDEYNHTAAELAWSRSLDVLRRVFRKESDLERQWEINTESKFFNDSLLDTMSTYVTHKNAAVTLGPTLAGGVGAKALRRFYENDFLSTKPPSMRLRLLSRTVGSDRVVDEVYTTFDHTLEMPWMLPGVPPTGRRVEVILVAIVALKADKIFTEHLYWDQASVLMQVGLLDPKLVPQGVVSGVKKLPVTGRESARRILNEHPARGEEYHQKLVASARAPSASSSSSTPKRPNRQSTSKKPEQRKTQAHANGDNGDNDGESSKASDNVSDAAKSLNGLGINDKSKQQNINEDANEGRDFADNESNAASPARPVMAARVESEKVE
ncbi:dienelactone hydrolase [Talaromyces islandicus]|uniref:Dienelactone hydrolase n=1 Tax=Talaromyces islandicus TaxID=28573 RepID=A0A0U1LZD4_TALIS|nr:dienelactone hydrolase [Talaromyces islandicus]